MWAIWLFGTLLLLLIAILLIPVSLRIDTVANKYAVNVGGVVSGSIVPTPDDFLLRVRIMGWCKDWSVVGLLARRKETKTRKPKGRRRGSKGAGRVARSIFKPKKVMQILRSFKVRQFEVDFDTDNYPLNAQLYPVFYFMDRGRGKFNINFNNKRSIKLNIVNRPARVIYALMKK